MESELEMAQVQVNQNTILVINEDLSTSIETHSWTLRDLLVTYKVPTKQWNDIWESLDDENAKESWNEADEDLDVQYLVGWFQGVAMALGCSEKDLVTL